VENDVFFRPQSEFILTEGINRTFHGKGIGLAGAQSLGDPRLRDRAPSTACQAYRYGYVKGRSAQMKH
jgi:hypothetical protein